MYAKEHKQLNATNNAEFPGAPMFTGRADTISHLIFSLEYINLPTEWSAFSASDVDERNLLPLQDAVVTDVLSLEEGDLDKSLEVWKDKAIYGYVPGLAGFQFWNVHEVAKMYLEKVPAPRRRMGKIAIVRVPFVKRTTSDAGEGGERCDLNLWGVVPADISLDELKVYREPINGALVLIRVNHEQGTRQIITYLLLSDHLSGSYLICPDRTGRVDLDVRIPERGDMSNSVYRQFALRKLCGDVRFGQ